EPTSVLGRAIPTPDVAAPRGTPDPIVRIPGASWVAPSRNSVYVVDPNPTGTESRLFLVDPQTGSARYVAEIDGNPMIARTNSGDRLVLASSMRGNDTARVVDAITGALVVSAPLQYRLVTTGAAVPTIAVSGDGRFF